MAPDDAAAHRIHVITTSSSSSIIVGDG